MYSEEPFTKRLFLCISFYGIGEGHIRKSCLILLYVLCLYICQNDFDKLPRMLRGFVQDIHV